MKIELPKNLPLIKLPSRVELTIFLIREELKNRKFTKGLEKVGFDTSDCSSDFSSLILALAGFQNRTDELYEWYFNQSEEYSEKFDLSDWKELNEQAFNFYIDLLMERRKVKQVLS
jgi:hypothetical protein